jgi:TonB family protein
MGKRLARLSRAAFRVMNSARSSFAVAMGVSVAVHAALFLALPRYHMDAPQVAWAGESAKQMTVVLEPEVLPPEEEPKPKFEMGDAKGKGYASHDAPAEREATAPEADTDQALLSLDPQGAGGSGADAAVAQAAGKGSLRGQPGGAPPSPPVALSVTKSPAESLTPLGLNPALKAPKRVVKPLPAPFDIQSGEATEDAGGEEIARAETTPPVLVDRQIIVPVKVSPTPAATPTPADGGFKADGAQQPAADPARMSDSESDAFSKLGTATFVDGDWRVRFGRKVKTRKPRLLLAGIDALLALNRAQVWLKVDIDPTGKVVGVKVTKSSGSNDIDQPTRVAMYDWWFEPKLDASGKPVPDQIEMRLAWR